MTINPSDYKPVFDVSISYFANGFSYAKEYNGLLFHAKYEIEMPGNVRKLRIEAFRKTPVITETGVRGETYLQLFEIDVYPKRIVFVRYGNYTPEEYKKVKEFLKDLKRALEEAKYWKPK